MAQDDLARSKKHEDGRQRVPAKLRPYFDEFVVDFRFASLKHYGTTMVSYEIIADLVLMGWRPPENRSAQNGSVTTE